MMYLDADSPRRISHAVLMWVLLLGVHVHEATPVYARAAAGSHEGRCLQRTTITTMMRMAGSPTWVQSPARRAQMRHSPVRMTGTQRTGLAGWRRTPGALQRERTMHCPCS